MALNGIDDTRKVIQAMGDKSYCTDGIDASAGLSSAIGSCGAKQVEHANAFATIARMGVYKPVSDIISVKNSQGQTLYEWEDKGEQVIDPQTAYIVSDILTDDNARRGTMGWRPTGFYINGIKTATKTGTSDIGGKKKDLWMMSYTPKATLSVWYGNHVPKALKNSASSRLGPLVAAVTTQVYNNVFKPDGTWKPGAWFTKPANLQTLTVSGKSDLFPSWYNKNQKKSTTVKMTFDRVSKKLATDCTPAAAREELDVEKITDPITKEVSYTAPDGYDMENKDDFHQCSDQRPFISTISYYHRSDGRYDISVLVQAGTNSVSDVVITVNNNSYSATQSPDGSWSIIVDPLSGSYSVQAVATDTGYYTGSGSQTLMF